MIPNTKPQQRTVLLRLATYLRRPNPDLNLAVLILEGTAALMHNRVPPQRARTTSVPIDAHTKLLIKRLRAADPDKPQHEIAAEVGTNQGRVNEVLIGKRS
jgi:hypothetical protein